MRIFNHKALAIAIASVGAIGTANAAGLDRSGQDITAFLQDGTYAEAVYTHVDADLTGLDAAGRAISDIAKPYGFFRYGVKTDINDSFSIGVLYDEPFGADVNYTGDNNFVSQGAGATYGELTKGTAAASTPVESVLRIAEWMRSGDQQLQERAKTTLTPRAGVAYYEKNKEELDKINSHLNAGQISREMSLWTLQGEKFRNDSGVKGLDGQPLDGKVGKRIGEEYFKQVAALANITQTAEDQKGQSTNVSISTNNVTMLMGAKFGTNKNFQIYGGPSVQRLNGEVHLRGAAYQRAQGYDAKIRQDQAVGWVAGASYSKPEIALKAALTYRSEIEHTSVINEVFPALGVAGVTSRDFSVALPESYNLDFQTGVNPTTLLTAKVRYVPWGNFDIRPPTYGDATAKSAGVRLPIVSYDKDQWQAEIGLGKKISDKLSVAGNIGYDSGSGSPATSLGPIKGYYSVGLGAKYSITPEWSLSLGGKYLKFGDTQAQLPTKAIVGKFEDNDGFIAGVKLAYHAK